jgi:hypothetical protein
MTNTPLAEPLLDFAPRRLPRSYRYRDIKGLTLMLVSLAHFMGQTWRSIVSFFL